MGFLKAATFSTDCSAKLVQKNNADPSKQEITEEMSNKFIVLFSSFEHFFIFLTSIKPYRNTSVLKSQQETTVTKE